MSEVVVLRADLSDLDALCKLESDYIPCPWNRNQLESALKDNRYALFAVRDNGKAVSYGGVCFALDEAEICNVVTDEKHRGKGYAEKILERIESECIARGAVKMFLEVAENNTPAKSLYKKRGFEKISVRKNYYVGGISAEIMEKKLL